MARLKSQVEKAASRKARIESLSQQLGYQVTYDSSYVRINTGAKVVTKSGFVDAIRYLESHLSRKKQKEGGK